MNITKQHFQALQKVSDEEFIQFLYETDAAYVLLTGAEGITAGNVKDALLELLEKLGKKANTTDIPDTSSFITKAVTDLVNYYTKTQIDQKVTDLEGKISAIPKFTISVVSELPESGADATLYLVKQSGSESQNMYSEYIWVNEAWEKLGEQKIDLTGYAKESWVTQQIANFQTSAQVQALIDAAIKKITDGTTVAAEATHAESADKLKTPRTVTAKGDVTGSVIFDGSADKDLNLTLEKTGVVAGTYSAVQVDEKGRVLKGGNLIEVGEEGQEEPSANLAVGGLFFKRVS